MTGLQPQAREAEAAILGAILIEKGAFDKVSDLLTTDSFYVTNHSKIFNACAELNKKNHPIDLVTVSQYLRDINELENIGGAYELVKLTNAVVSSAHITNHAKIIHEKYILRRIITLCSELTAKALSNESDPFELCDLAEKHISTISDVKQTDVLHIQVY